MGSVLSICLPVLADPQWFEAIGGQCVFTSEWNKHAVRTYKANWYCDPQQHRFNEDIRDITLSQRSDVSDEEAARHIRESILGMMCWLAPLPAFLLPASLKCDGPCA